MQNTSDPEFECFWLAYPLKVKKGEARKAWFQTAAIRPEMYVLLDALERAKRSVQWHKADREGNVGAYIPHASSWLRAEGWDDDYTVRLPAVGSKAPDTSSNLPPPASEEQKQRARELMSTVHIKGVA